MALGPGKYDKQCTRVRTETEAQGVILLVFLGNQGNGFDVQLSEQIIQNVNIPAMLRHIAEAIEREDKTAFGN